MEISLITIFLCILAGQRTSMPVKMRLSSQPGISLEVFQIPVMHVNK